MVTTRLTGRSSASMAATFEPIDAPRAHKKNPQPPIPEEPDDHALGRSRGGYGTKIHLVCDGVGQPITATVSGGQEHESKFFETLLDQVHVAGRVGRPRSKPDSVAGDKAYSVHRIRDWLDD